MNADTLDMSTFIKNHTFRAGQLGLLRAEGTRPITLAFKASNVIPPAAGRTLIMRARRGVEELWGIRMMPSGRLLFQPGTGSSRESFYGYITDLSLGVSFNPLTGSWSVMARETDGAACESFNVLARNPWSESDGDYEILVGSTECFDRTPLGWTIDCSFRYRPAEPGREDSALGAEEPWRGDPQIRKAKEPYGPGLVAALRDDVDAERHWEAMLALASGRHLLPAALDTAELALEAQALVDAHNAWKEGRS